MGYCGFWFLYEKLNENPNWDPMWKVVPYKKADIVDEELIDFCN